MQDSEEAAAVGGLWRRLVVHVQDWGVGVRQWMHIATTASVSLCICCG